MPARFLLAESEDALWVAFMGTKNARDLLTNGHILMGPVWPELSPDEPGRAAAAHKGYLSRARGIPVEQLYAEAWRRGKRLVLCGASQHAAILLPLELSTEYCTWDTQMESPQALKHSRVTSLCDMQATAWALR